MEITLDEYKKAYREIVKDEAKRGFLVHLIIYILVNAMLIAINLIYSPEAIWFFYPLIGWGIGLTMHFISMLWVEKEMEKREARAEYLAREKKRV